MLRDIVKHASIYGIAVVVSRMTSILLLPVYTRYLSPGEYGITAILDLLASVIGIVITSGMGSAVNRYHFSTEDEEERDRIWWTGLLVLILSASTVVTLCLIFRNVIAQLTIGTLEPHAPLFIALLVSRVGFGGIGALLQVYLRAKKWSTLFVGISLIRLTINVVLNLTLLIGFNLGIRAILIGNLIATIFTTSTLIWVFARSRGTIAFTPSYLPQFIKFGGPLILTVFLNMTTHQADRMLLRAFVTMDQIGIYSFAYQLAQGVNSLILFPFMAIWATVQFEVAQLPNADETYRRIFRYVNRFVLMILLGISLFAKQLVALLASPAYTAAAQVVPVICLAYCVFSVSDFVNLPAVLGKKTWRLLPGAILASTFNISANIVLIPQFGMVAAAWVTVGTFLVMCTANQIMCRSLRDIRWPFQQTALLLAVAVVFYAVAHRYDVPVIVSGILWLVMAGLLFAEPIQFAMCDKSLAWLVGFARGTNTTTSAGIK